jgi:hypothetical protein
MKSMMMPFGAAGVVLFVLLGLGLAAILIWLTVSLVQRARQAPPMR